MVTKFGGQILPTKFGFVPDWLKGTIFTRGQFWPSGIVITHVCVSVSVCVYQSLACLHDNSSAVQARIIKFET